MLVRLGHKLANKFNVMKIFLHRFADAAAPVICATRTERHAWVSNEGDAVSDLSPSSKFQCGLLAGF